MADLFASVSLSLSLSRSFLLYSPPFSFCSSLISQSLYPFSFHAKGPLHFSLTLGSGQSVLPMMVIRVQACLSVILDPAINQATTLFVSDFPNYTLFENYPSRSYVSTLYPYHKIISIDFFFFLYFSPRDPIDTVNFH